MCAQRVYSVVVPESAWQRLPGRPSDELVARVRDELERMAAEMPIREARGAGARVMPLEGGYNIIVVTDHTKSTITLVEVTQST
jgi:hypothetical protein